MKKYLLLLLLVGSVAFAQEKPKFGVNLGGTYANIRGNEAADKNKYDLNFLVGISVEVPLNERFSFVGNVNYERKTFKNTITAPIFIDENFDPIMNSRNVDVKVRLEYITLPLNLKYYFDSQKKVYINGGPFLGVFLDSTSKVEGEKTNEDANGLFKSLDFGANLGVGTNFKINEKNSLNLELRHNYGLSNISDVRVVGDGSVKTNSFNLIANWQFGL
ncbi:hypothetical protein J2X31_000746 [Flavobacterium arsenatis]|uniref:Outer membrane protein beta-barrel domain-containing protein n=1 Tax=Flavobacterium arsenatis TaxID=1484332 RepID=A0ABU1TL92_9FLAO|nr:porin family protein [Flavobacterium arsenatis]MDR6966748.1 hypothetical protein [Flavobacterium arsenatis]